MFSISTTTKKECSIDDSILDLLNEQNVKVMQEKRPFCVGIVTWIRHRNRQSCLESAWNSLRTCSPNKPIEAVIVYFIDVFKEEETLRWKWWNSHVTYCFGKSRPLKQLADAVAVTGNFVEIPVHHRIKFPHYVKVWLAGRFVFRKRRELAGFDLFQNQAWNVEQRNSRAELIINAINQSNDRKK